MRALVQAMRKTWAGGDPAQWLVLTARCSLPGPGELTAFHHAKLPGGMLHWAPPLLSSDDLFSIAGRGEAAHIKESGADALPLIRNSASALLSQVVEAREDGCAAAPPPRLYGGLRFVPDPTPRSVEDPWQAFPDASFTLPRWQLLCAGSSSYLRLAVQAGELRELFAIERELAAIEQALHPET